MYRKCPVCKNKISPWQLFKPGLTRKAGPVICDKCNSTISPPWSEYNWFGLFGYGMCWLLLRQIPMEKLGMESQFLYYGVILLIGLLIVMVPMYFLFPLRKIEN